ncbi:hypothetical protein B0H17DRAFT_1276923 [Mycena rosella]|uniref:Uncharacterized protein n=1 Tax=Mycena rosella TaxID=1033263 RepID=A0AAD7C6F7_MYCRO|nr:hypothetical protein B0H17DRAFT_1276923 [Mycena rosella]
MGHLGSDGMASNRIGDSKLCVQRQPEASGIRTAWNRSTPIKAELDFSDTFHQHCLVDCFSQLANEDGVFQSIMSSRSYVLPSAATGHFRPGKFTRRRCTASLFILAGVSTLVALPLLAPRARKGRPSFVQADGGPRDADSAVLGYPLIQANTEDMWITTIKVNNGEMSSILPDMNIVLNYREEPRVVFNPGMPDARAGVLTSNDATSFKHAPRPTLSKYYKDAKHCIMPNEPKGFMMYGNDANSFLLYSASANFTTDLYHVMSQSKISLCFANVLFHCVQPGLRPGLVYRHAAPAISVYLGLGGQIMMVWAT